MRDYLHCITVADISDADDTTQFTIEAPAAGVVEIQKCFLRWSEATGTQSSTQGVVSIEVAGTEVATLTANISDAIGETQVFTGATTDTNGNTINSIDFAAGADIVIKTKTQAVGGTVTGDGDVFLGLHFGL